MGCPVNLTDFKAQYLASDFKLTLTGSYYDDQLHFPGWYDEVFLLIAIDQQAQDMVETTLQIANEAYENLHSKKA